MKKAVKEDLVKELRSDREFTEKLLRENPTFELENAIKLWKEEWKTTEFRAQNFLRNYYKMGDIKRTTFKSYKSTVNKWIENFFRGYIRNLEYRLKEKNKEKEVIQ